MAKVPVVDPLDFLKAYEKPLAAAFAVAKAYKAAGGKFKEVAPGEFVPENPALYDDCKAEVAK